MPQRGNLHDLLQNYVGDTPLADFVIGILMRELEAEQKYTSENRLVPLVSIERYSDPMRVAQRLTDALKTLPWQYCLSIPLPPSISEGFRSHLASYTLSDQICLITPDNAHTTAFPLISETETQDWSFPPSLATPFKIPPMWNNGAVYFQIKARGFISEFGLTAPLLKAVTTLREFYGLAIALRLIKFDKWSRVTAPSSEFYIHRELDHGWIFDRTYELDSSQADTLTKLSLHDLNGVLDSDIKRAGWLTKNLGLMKAVFSGDDRAQRLRLAAQWFFDSYCGSDELLQFVQSAIVVEILLGEKASSDLMGLSELLANRCAYLIASTHKERSEILKDFRSIYAVRSQIVHHGKSRLTLKEQVLTDKLRTICRRILRKEAELLQKDTQSDA